MFHDILGEDAKYLSDGEEFGSQELFIPWTAKPLIQVKMAKAILKLKYLELMWKIRDDQPGLFER